MLKLMRKYNKWLMVVLGSFLMVTFLFTGTSTLFQPDPMKRVVARLDGEALRFKEFNLAERELSFLREVFPGLAQRDVIEDALHWHLLVREAKAAGLVGYAEDGAKSLDQVVQGELIQEAQRAAAAELGAGADPNAIIQRAIALFNDPDWTTRTTEAMRGSIEPLILSRGAGAGLNVEQTRLALAHLRGVERLLGLEAQALRLSAPRARLEARRFNDRATVAGVVVPADKLVSAIASAPADRVAQQFEAYKAVAAGTPPMGFGYLQPPRVKLEYLRIEAAAVRSAITLDPVELGKFWHANRARFPGEFAAERANVEAAMRERRVEEIFADIDRLYKSRLRRATRALPSDQGRRVLPADWASQQPRMAAVATELVAGLQESSKITLPPPAAIILDDAWMPVRELSSLPGIGPAIANLGTRQPDLATLVAETYELGAGSPLGLQVGVPFDQPLRDADGNAYYLQILAAAKESAPQSLDEVREQVERDTRLLMAYEQLLERREATLEAVRELGLEGLAQLFPDDPGAPGNERLTRFESAMVRRPQGDGSQIALDDDAVRSAIMDAADALPLGESVSDQPVASRLVAVAVPAQRGLGFFLITDVTRTTQEQARRADRQLTDLAANEERLAVFGQDGTRSAGAFSLASLKQRWSYQGPDDRRPEDGPEPTATP